MNQEPYTESVGECPPPPPNPSFEYQDPFKEVKAAQDELEKDKKRNEAHQAALKVLDQAAKEREQARSAYEKAEEALSDAHAELTDDAARVLKNAKLTVGDTVAKKIDDIVLGYGACIPKAKTEVDDLKKAARELSAKYRQAAWAREDAQEEFNDVKDTPKDKGDSIKLAKGLLARAEKEENGDDPRIYYYLAERLFVHVSDEKIDALAVVKKTFKDKFDVLSQKVEAERVALFAWEEKKVELERAKKNLAEWKFQRDERMLPEVFTIKRSASGGAGYQGSATKQTGYEQPKRTTGVAAA